jgi:DNA replication protein DnaC
MSKTLSPNPTSGNLEEALKELRLGAMRESLAEVADGARKESHSYEQFLSELIRRELDARRQRRVERLLHESRLPLEKTLLQFDRKRLPVKVNQQLSTLLDGSFLNRRENVLVFGNPGSGKTHFLCALGQELILRKRSRILFAKCAVLVQELLAAKRNLVLPKFFARLAAFEGLIVDDIAYVQQARERGFFRPSISPLHALPPRGGDGQRRQIAVGQKRKEKGEKGENHGNVHVLRSSLPRPGKQSP